MKELGDPGPVEGARPALRKTKMPLLSAIMRSRVAEINENAVSHVLGDKAVEPGDHLCDGAVIRADDLAQILGIEAGGEGGRADHGAEHDSRLPTFGIGLCGASREAAAAVAGTSAPSAAMASSSRRRCPTKVMPRSFKSSAVRLGRTLSSISFSRNAGT